MRQGGRGAADVGVGADLLAPLDGPLEQEVEHRAGAGLAPGRLPRPTDLAQDLMLAQHHRVEPGRHLEQVTDGVLVVVGVEVGVEPLRVDPGEQAQGPPHVTEALVEALGVDVDLGPVAGGEDDGLGHHLAPRHLGQSLGHLVGGQRHRVE